MFSRKKIVHRRNKIVPKNWVEKCLNQRKFHERAVTVKITIVKMWRDFKRSTIFSTVDIFVTAVIRV